MRAIFIDFVALAMLGVAAGQAQVLQGNVEQNNAQITTPDEFAAGGTDPGTDPGGTGLGGLPGIPGTLGLPAKCSYEPPHQLKDYTTQGGFDPTCKQLLGQADALLAQICRTPAGPQQFALSRQYAAVQQQISRLPRCWPWMGPGGVNAKVPENTPEKPYSCQAYWNEWYVRAMAECSSTAGPGASAAAQRCRDEKTAIAKGGLASCGKPGTNGQPANNQVPAANAQGACVDRCLANLQRDLNAAESAPTLSEYNALTSRALAANKSCLLQCPNAGREAPLRGGIIAGIWECGWETYANPQALATIGGMIALGKFSPLNDTLALLYSTASLGLRMMAAKQLMDTVQGGATVLSDDPYAQGDLLGRKFCMEATALLGLAGPGNKGGRGGAASESGPSSMRMPGGLQGVLTGQDPPYVSGRGGPSINMPTGLQGVLNGTDPPYVSGQTGPSRNMPTGLLGDMQPRAPAPGPKANVHLLLKDPGAWLKTVNPNGCSGACVPSTLAVDYALRGKGSLSIPPLTGKGYPVGTSGIIQNVYGRPPVEMPSVPDAINTIYKAGDGATGILELDPPNIGANDPVTGAQIAGHVLNIVNDKGDVRFLDASAGVQRELSLQEVLQWAGPGVNVFLLQTQ